MVSGRVTAELELAKKGKFAPIENIPVNVETVSNKSSGKKHYEIIMDSRGTLLWKDDSEYDKDMLIITSETVSKEYLEYLDQKHISYIASGEEKIDLVRAMEILGESFGVKTVGVVGGSKINTAFLDAGLLGEVLLLIGAGIDGRPSFPTVFEGNEERSLILLKLVEAKAYESGAVLVRYKTK